MSVSPACPYCHSHDPRVLIAAVIGVSGYRCHDCGRVFYRASHDVAKQIQDAQVKRTTRRVDGEPAA